jgi:hypothetical protein
MKQTMDSLLLQIVLTRAFGLAAGKRTFVISLASVNARVASEMARRAEAALAHWANMVLFRVRRRVGLVVSLGRWRCWGRGDCGGRRHAEMKREIESSGLRQAEIPLEARE